MSVNDFDDFDYAFRLGHCSGHQYVSKRRECRHTHTYIHTYIHTNNNKPNRLKNLVSKSQKLIESEVGGYAMSIAW